MCFDWGGQKPVPSKLNRPKLRTTYACINYVINNSWFSFCTGVSAWNFPNCRPKLKFCKALQTSLPQSCAYWRPVWTVPNIGCELWNKASVVVFRDEPSPRENIVLYGRGKTFVCMKTFIFWIIFPLLLQDWSIFIRLSEPFKMSRLLQHIKRTNTCNSSHKKSRKVPLIKIYLHEYTKHFSLIFSGINLMKD